jgi:hypothetical protein
MEHKPALYAIIKLHAELAFRIKRNQDEASGLREDMLHVEAVLKLLEPGFSVRQIAPKRRYNPNPLFRRGTIFRAALAVLREAPEPMTAEEIASALLASKGVAEPSKAERERMYGAVAASLSNRRGKIVTADDGRPMRWKLIPQE